LCTLLVYELAPRCEREPQKECQIKSFLEKKRKRYAMTMKVITKGAAVFLMASRASSFVPVASTFASTRSVSTLNADATASQSPKVDYVNHIESLSHLLSDTKEKLAKMKLLASELKELESVDPSLSDLGSGKEAENLRKALAEAKAACDAYGPNSPEAKVAWMDLELAAEHHEGGDRHPSYRYSAAALKAHHYYNAAVDPGLLSDTVKAIETIEVLSHFVEVEKNRLEEQPWLTT
jgi:hypothetical protein